MVTKFLVDQHDAEGIMLWQIIQNFGIPETLFTSQNDPVSVDILNKSDKDITFITLTNSITTIPLNQNEFEIFNIDNDNSQNNSKPDIENILRASHMTPEKKEHIIRLCKKYSDIFFTDKQPLTFTNQVKHYQNQKRNSGIYEIVGLLLCSRTRSGTKNKFHFAPRYHSTQRFTCSIQFLDSSREADGSRRKKWRIVVH